MAAILSRPQCVNFYRPSHKPHNALDKYPATHNFGTEMCTHVYICGTKCCIVGYGIRALWDLCNSSVRVVILSVNLVPVRKDRSNIDWHQSMSKHIKKQICIWDPWGVSCVCFLSGPHMWFDHDCFISSMNDVAFANMRYLLHITLIMAIVILRGVINHICHACFSRMNPWVHNCYKI